MVKFKLVALLLISLLLWFACTKDQADNAIPVVKYNPIGKYKVTQHIYSSGTWPYTNTFKDTFTSVTQGNSDSTYFLFGGEFLINESGSFIHCSQTIQGRLWNDSLYFWTLCDIKNDSTGYGFLFAEDKGVRISKTP